MFPATDDDASAGRVFVRRGKEGHKTQLFLASSLLWVKEKEVLRKSGSGGKSGVSTDASRAEQTRVSREKQLKTNSRSS